MVQIAWNNELISKQYDECYIFKNYTKYGDIALVSQSGAICAATVEDAIAQGIGFSKVISMGNKVDMDENDILELLSEDDETRVIVMYLEDIHDGKRFMQTLKR